MEQIKTVIEISNKLDETENKFLAIEDKMREMQIKNKILEDEDYSALERQHKDELTTLCRKYGIQQLGVFGSAATGDFVPSESDIDFILEFQVSDPGIADRLLDFPEAAEALLGTSVDILIESAISNPYLRHTIGQSREAIYDADSNHQAAA